MEYGHASRKYRCDGHDPKTYGYTYLNEFANRFNQLASAWNSVVQIDILWDGDYRIEVHFSAI
ncbi:MAG: hypothetical protein AAB731_03845 [Patescibacteria group bacterium]